MLAVWQQTEDLETRWVEIAIARERVVELEQLVRVGFEEDTGFDIGFGDGNATKKASTNLDAYDIVWTQQPADTGINLFLREKGRTATSAN